MIRAAIALSLSVAALARATADEPTLATVLDRAGAYVAEFHRELATLVGEERYVQDWKRVTSGSHAAPTLLKHRELRADLLIVKPPGADAWMGLRDVFEVDGRDVRDRHERIADLFLDRSETTDAQIQAILNETARYNVGDITRNMNTPVFPLLFLERANHYRFKFKRTAERTPGAVRPGASADGAFRVSTEVWVIAYDEKESGTMIRTTGRKDLPAHGRFWIEPDTGRVLMSELITENRELRATIDVSFQSEPLSGMLVPIEMHELYEGRRTGSRIEAVATYGRFRRLQK
jgi:hypothetical protein